MKVTGIVIVKFLLSLVLLFLGALVLGLLRETQTPAFLRIGWTAIVGISFLYILFPKKFSWGSTDAVLWFKNLIASLKKDPIVLFLIISIVLIAVTLVLTS